MRGVVVRTKDHLIMLPHEGLKGPPERFHIGLSDSGLGV